ncbi:hypothetical protein PSHT_12909 [Puccinia striiformis]|uniref:Secreted protein n=1 Tax=Puccinia striiformis TaxID=27350 RepID=A0A2S4UTR8_9BASI|nr:hypothetical protein PSHT_12909 [Puccinia striiformis]
MILILGLIHCGATYARFPCNNPAYPGPHQGTCSRPVKLSDFARGVPPQKKERIMKSMTIVAPAKPSKGQFTCDQVSVRGLPSEKRKCCQFSEPLQAICDYGPIFYLLVPLA